MTSDYSCGKIRGSGAIERPDITGAYALIKWGIITMTPEMIADMLASAKEHQAASDKWPLSMLLPCKGKHIKVIASRANPVPVILMTRLTCNAESADYICPVCRSLTTVKAADTLEVK